MNNHTHNPNNNNSTAPPVPAGMISEEVDPSNLINNYNDEEIMRMYLAPFEVCYPPP